MTLTLTRYREVKAEELDNIFTVLQWTPKTLVLAVSADDKNPIPFMKAFWGPYRQIIDPIETGFRPIRCCRMGKKVEVALTQEGFVVCRQQSDKAEYGTWSYVTSPAGRFRLFVTQ